MKITKHCHEECSGNIEVAQGALLGLIVGKTLEITNCFAFPKNYDDTIDEGNFTLLGYVFGFCSVRIENVFCF